MFGRLVNYLLGEKVRRSMATSILGVLLMGLHWVQAFLGVTIPADVLAQFSQGTIVILEIILTGLVTSYFDKKIQKLPEVPKIIK